MIAGPSEIGILADKDANSKYIAIDLLSQAEHDEMASSILITTSKDLDQAIDLMNEIAPEHLEVLTSNPFELLPKIKHAGAIFLGENTPEPIGDYVAGPNHTLPTGGTAKFFSPLGVDNFMKRSSIISFSKQAIDELGEQTALFADTEGLTAHAQSIRERL
jgi:histidinol dehydrogenase